MKNLKFVCKPTDYGTYRELLKDGNKIVGWVEQRPKTNSKENEMYFYAYGKPSQTSFISFNCKTLKQAKEEIVNNLDY